MVRVERNRCGIEHAGFSSWISASFFDFDFFDSMAIYVKLLCDPSRNAAPLSAGLKYAWIYTEVIWLQLQDC